MKIIVNRGFDKIITKIVISKNKKEIMICPIKQDYCTFDAKEGDQIVIKLRFLGGLTLPIASFNCHKTDNTFYISPTSLFKRWILVNYMIFPGIYLLLYVIQKAMIGLNLYNWFYTSIVAMWALSLICMGFCQYVKFMRQRMFKLEKI